MESLSATMADRIINLIAFVLKILEVYVEAIYRLFVPPPMRSLTGEIILVTGSARGLGKSICRQLSEFRVTLIMWDCDQVENDATARELRDLPETKARIFPYAVDLSVRRNVEVAAAKLKQEIGDVSVVINNAGIAPIGQFLLQDIDLLEKTFRVNVISHFWIIKEFLPRMIESHHGHIATVGSIGSFRQECGSVPYYSSKAAVHGYIESLKLQMKRCNAHGIRFTTIYPYFINCGMMKEVTYAEKSKFLQRYLPLLTPDEVAEKLIEGIRRSYEYIYCPWFLPYLLQLDNLLPVKLRKEAYLFFDDQLEHPAFPKRVQI